jgi:hypothetical protein
MDNSQPTQQRITWIYQRNKDGSLELAPPFQRKSIWCQRSKSYLIDTIINNLPIPEIYIQIKTDKEGKTRYIVVDGQQRIRSIIEFLEGNFVIDKKDNIKYGGKKFSELTDEIKKSIWDYSLVIRELKTEKDSEIRGIFRRLNKNVIPLNRQELRNAMFVGQFMLLMNKIATEDSFFVDNKIFTPSDVKRMIDAEFISELFIGMMNGVQKKDQEIIDKFYSMYDVEIPKEECLYKKFKAIENEILKILKDLRPTRWHYKKEFYALFLAMSELYDKYYFPEEKEQKIRDELVKFSKNIDKTLKDKKGKISRNPLVREFSQALIDHPTTREQRIKRVENVKNTIIPFLKLRDSRKSFNDTERRMAWHSIKNKKCGICGKKIKWEEFDLDHFLSYNKGGKTDLKNSQVTHKCCNRRKSNK